MSLFLKLDEAQEALARLDHPQARAFEVALCAIGDGMAAALRERLECATGATTQQGKGFAGICLAVRPVFKGQPFPELLEDFDDGGREEWEEDSARLVTPWPGCAPIAWMPVTEAMLAEGMRVRCANGMLGLVHSFATGRRALVTVEYDGGAAGAWDFGRLETVAPAEDSDLAEAAEGETCEGCGRASIDCSRDPCADVIADREA
ncbi:MAG: hypothetical protein V4696_03880 [Pseudomonadota bacterium]